MLIGSGCRDNEDRAGCNALAVSHIPNSFLRHGKINVNGERKSKIEGKEDHLE